MKDLAHSFIHVIPRSMLAIRHGMRESAREQFSVPQFRVLAQLWVQSQTNGELADHIGVSVPAMSRLVETLVRAGLVGRVPQSHDRRQVLLSLTEAGQKRFLSLQQTTQMVFKQKFSQLNADQKKKLAEGLSILEDLFT